MLQAFGVNTWKLWRVEMQKIRQHEKSEKQFTKQTFFRSWQLHSVCKGFKVFVVEKVKQYIRPIFK